MNAATIAALAILLVVPMSTALPGACIPACEIQASSVGYDPAVVVLASGASVVWSSTDVAHATRDAGVGAGAQACFMVAAGQGESSASVRFDIIGAALVATVEGESTTCVSAIGNAAGGFVVPYFCTLHPTMRAALVVTL